MQKTVPHNHAKPFPASRYTMLFVGVGGFDSTALILISTIKISEVCADAHSIEVVA
jgi:hypothetical protein